MEAETRAGGVPAGKSTPPPPTRPPPPPPAKSPSKAHPVTLKGHTRPLTVAVLSPEGHALVTASLDGSVRVWDVRTGVQIGKPLVEDGPPVLALSVMSTMVACGTESGVVFAMDLVTRSSYLSVDLSAGIQDADKHFFCVHGKVFTTTIRANTVEAAFAGEGKEIFVFNLRTGSLCCIAQGHDDSVLCSAADGATLVTGSLDNTCRGWQWDGTPAFVLRDFKRPISAVFVRGAKLLVGTSADRLPVWTWDQWQASTHTIDNASVKEVFEFGGEDADTFMAVYNLGSAQPSKLFVNELSSTPTFLSIFNENVVASLADGSFVSRNSDFLYDFKDPKRSQPSATAAP